MKNIFCFIYLIFLPFLTFSRAFSQNHTFDSLANEINRLSMYNKTKSLELLDSLYKMAYNSSDSSLFLSRCLYEESTLKLRQGIKDTLLSIKIKEKLEREHTSKQEEALLYFALGANCVYETKYAEAFENTYQALELFKQLGDNQFIAKALNLLGSICSIIQLFNLADYYHSEALSYVSDDSHDFYFIKSNIFRLLSKNDLEAAIDSMLILIDDVIKVNYLEFLPSLYINIGSFLLSTDPEQSLYYFNKIQELNFENSKMTMMLNGNMGFYYAIKKDYKKALNYYKVVQEMTEKNNDFEYLAFAYNDLSIVFEELNQNDSALFYARKHAETSQKLRSNTVAIETHQKLITTYLEAKENELIIAEQKNALKHRQILIIVIVSVSVVLFILLFLLYINRQKQIKILENNELLSKLEHEEKVLQYEKRQRKLEKEKQEDKLNSKIREITTYSVLVSNKNHILKRIFNIINEDNNKETLQKVKKIQEIVKSNLDIEDEWNNFKLHFEKVHPNFFVQLKKICADLTDENLKLCAYIKMRMSTKQIAQLLHVIPKTITISRYRIKKKLKLSETEDLDSYIGKI